VRAALVYCTRGLTFYLAFFEGLVGVDGDIKAVSHKTKYFIHFDLWFSRYSRSRKNPLVLYAMTTTNHWLLLEMEELLMAFLLENPARL
jgi:hypothetical protein